MAAKMTAEQIAEAQRLVRESQTYLHQQPLLSSPQGIIVWHKMACSKRAFLVGDDPAVRAGRHGGKAQASRYGVTKGLVAADQFECKRLQK